MRKTIKPGLIAAILAGATALVSGCKPVSSVALEGQWRSPIESRKDQPFHDRYTVGIAYEAGDLESGLYFTAGASDGNSREHRLGSVIELEHDYNFKIGVKKDLFRNTNVVLKRAEPAKAAVKGRAAALAVEAQPEVKARAAVSYQPAVEAVEAQPEVKARAAAPAVPATTEEQRNKYDDQADDFRMRAEEARKKSLTSGKNKEAYTALQTEANKYDTQAELYREKADFEGSPAVAAVPYQPAVEAVKGKAEVPAQPAVPYQPAVPGVPAIPAIRARDAVAAQPEVRGDRNKNISVYADLIARMQEVSFNTPVGYTQEVRGDLKFGVEAGLKARWGPIYFGLGANVVPDSENEKYGLTGTVGIQIVK